MTEGNGVETAPPEVHIFDEIIVFPVMCVDPFNDGGPIFQRLGMSHRVEGCNWSTDFEGAPSSAISAARVIGELEAHKLSCPTQRSGS